jgi:hypothetical protein
MESLVSSLATSRLLPSSRYIDSNYYSRDSSSTHTNSQTVTVSGSRTQPPSVAPKQVEEASMKPSREHCDRRRPVEDNPSRLPNISQQFINQSMTPFLREHIPSQYAPLGKPDLPSTTNLKNKDPNSKYCYRHRPDSKCRRAADESKMALIQSVCWCLARLVTIPFTDSMS